MAKVAVDYEAYWPEAQSVLANEGALLVSSDETGKPNAMTIGWGTLGRIWGKPILAVYVRPSRYTFELIEETGDFTVNLLPRNMTEVTAFCGSASGRDRDKLAELGLTATPSQRVKSPTIEQALVSWECAVVHRNDILEEKLSPEIVDTYAQGEYHRIYHGEVMAARATEDARERLAQLGHA
jgi:flavin reductase (DIM6/NTAB) family NADH-FMN oxidoreductase RutF